MLYASDKGITKTVPKSSWQTNADKMAKIQERGVKHISTSPVIRNGNISQPISASSPDCPEPHHVNPYPHKSATWQ